MPFTAPVFETGVSAIPPLKHSWMIRRILYRANPASGAVLVTPHIKVLAERFELITN